MTLGNESRTRDVRYVAYEGGWQASCWGKNENKYFHNRKLEGYYREMLNEDREKYEKVSIKREENNTNLSSITTSKRGAQSVKQCKNVKS